jgi:hypothetical protein
VPFGFGDNVELDHDPASLRQGRNPFRRIDLTLYELPIPDFTTTYGIYFATPPLADQLRPLRGLRERDFNLSFDPQMRELGAFEGKQLPELVCFKVTGIFGVDDFAHIEGEADLLLSERAAAVLRRFDLGQLGSIRRFRPAR